MTRYCINIKKKTLKTIFDDFKVYRIWFLLKVLLFCRMPEGVVKNILDIQTTVALLPDIVTAQYVCLLHSIMSKENQKNEGNVLEVVRSLCSTIQKNEQSMPKV